MVGLGTNVDTSPCNESGSLLVKSHACDFPGCKARFSRPWKLSAHRCTHTGERPYKCKVTGCNKSYTNLTHLRRHEQISHSEGDKKPKTANGTKPRSLIRCEYQGCCRLFAKQESLNRHTYKHHNIELSTRLKCSDCGLAFTDGDQLKGHMLTHRPLLPFKCDQSQVTEHVQVAHKRYKCPVAVTSDSVLFASANELRSHAVQAHPTSFVCDVCDKVFTMKCRLNEHKMSCGSANNAKPYKCPINDCEHMFKFKRNMLQHVRHKHRSPLFICTVDNCNKSFIWKSSYKKHVGVMHGRETNEKKNANPRKMKRKRRKDADVPKHCVAEILSGVTVDKQTKLRLISKQQVGIENIQAECKRVALPSTDS